MRKFATLFAALAVVGALICSAAQVAAQVSLRGLPPGGPMCWSDDRPVTNTSSATTWNIEVEDLSGCGATLDLDTTQADNMVVDVGGSPDIAVFTVAGSAGRLSPSALEASLALLFYRPSATVPDAVLRLQGHDQDGTGNCLFVSAPGYCTEAAAAVPGRLLPALSARPSTIFVALVDVTADGLDTSTWTYSPVPQGDSPVPQEDPPPPRAG